ncbi:YutD family protein [Companilactobacillus heilongjiangensis]|uniref:YutD family protein n=1 Tax=Companilactobacillus heilongjiangensis TaxID=1074467 RepID=UPI00069E06A5|nr:YutD family protein [Companilactobacillus heilongjiangensis]
MQEIEDNTATTKLVDVIKLDDNLISIDKTQYRIVENHDSGFSEERIEERYNNVLEKYDYIVGDWGYDQLRFKGFYEDERNESTLENRISHLEDYLLEYCNFGCAYFVLEKVKKAPLRNNNHRKNNSNNRNNSHSAHTHTHKFRTRTTTRAKAENKPNKPHNNNNQHRKAKVSKRRTNNSNKKTTSTKKTFKIRKIGEKNK